MSYLSELYGNVKDYGENPQESVKVSIYRKVGEAYTDIDGNYSNIKYLDSEDHLVKFEKDDFYSAFKEYPLNGQLNVVLSKSDPSYPNIPNFFRAQDFLTGDSVMLVWGNIEFDFIAGFNIYRTTDLTKPFDKININIIKESSFIDTGVTPGIDYYYILEVISANSQNYFQGVSVRTSIVGPVNIIPSQIEGDLTPFAKLKIDSTKTNREGEKLFDENPNTWWESARGEGAWIELVFNEEKYINSFYFRKKSVSRGITFATLQFWNGTKFVDIQNVNYLREIDYTFKDFTVKTNRLRFFVKKTEHLTEAELVEVRVYGF